MGVRLVDLSMLSITFGLIFIDCVAESICQVHAEAKTLSVPEWNQKSKVIRYPFCGIYRASDGTVYLTNQNKLAPVVGISPGNGDIHTQLL